MGIVAQMIFEAHENKVYLARLEAQRVLTPLQKKAMRKLQLYRDWLPQSAPEGFDYAALDVSMCLDCGVEMLHNSAPAHLLALERILLDPRRAAAVSYYGRLVVKMRTGYQCWQTRGAAMSFAEIAVVLGQDLTLIESSWQRALDAWKSPQLYAFARGDGQEGFALPAPPEREYAEAA